MSLAWNSDRGSTEGSARGESTLREYADLASIVLVLSKARCEGQRWYEQFRGLRGAAEDALERVRLGTA